MARHIFQACPVWIYTQSNITSILDCTCFLLSFMLHCFINPPDFGGNVGEVETIFGRCCCLAHDRHGKLGLIERAKVNDVTYACSTSYIYGTIDGTYVSVY
jgi:hypothetical protein